MASGTRCFEDIQAIMRGLRDSPAILAGFVREIPEDVLHRKRGEGFWSIAEHVVHLAAVQPMLAERLRRILTEDMPEFVPFIPSEEDARSKPPMPGMEEALSDFAAGRERIVEILNAAMPEDWDRLAAHPEYDCYGLRILARHILMHDHWHMFRMEELWLTRDAFLTRLEG
ncbi:DinB family protein [Desulfovibrio aminophilus]|nr:DinB family protein [Desulfovibrio aminophilus]MCM0756203.1 DinB family protein [Desulfovibrio aminophilus]